MTTVLINEKSEDGLKLLQYIKHNMHVAQVMNESDTVSSPVPDEELVSLKEFKAYMETLAYERLGLQLTL